jgi:hypothetical protein
VGDGLLEGDSLANHCETIVKHPTEQGWKAMKAWQQWLMDQTKQPVKQHLTMKQDEWNSRVEEAMKKNTSLAFKLIREPQWLAKGYVMEKNGQMRYDAKAVIKEQENLGQMVGSGECLRRRPCHRKHPRCQTLYATRIQGRCRCLSNRTLHALTTRTQGTSVACGMKP